jgi:oligopeptide/dipeptide ABC transporter ATP-binding protein
MGRALLEVRDLSVTFRRRGAIRTAKSSIKAVDNVSFQIRESEFLSIVGETGSGKSTIARCILGLEKPTAGSVIYNGINVANLGRREIKKYRKEVQIIYQDPFGSLNPRHTVFRIISIPLMQLKGEKDRAIIRRTVEDLLEEVGLEPSVVLYRYPHQLSGGQRQRVNIARALAPGPTLLVADEPITMLDAAQRLNTLALLMDLQSKRKLSVLMITHDLASAKVTSDRIISLYQGKVMETGRANDILTSPFHPYVQLILDSNPVIGSTSKEIDFESYSKGKNLRDHGCVFSGRCVFATDHCGTEEAKLLELAPSHFAACFHPLNQKASSS